MIQIWSCVSMWTLCLIANMTWAKCSENTNKEENNSLLWKISKPGLVNSSYLFGTVHLICQDDFFWTDLMQKALDKSEKVCFEIDMDDMASQMQMASKMMLTEEETLAQYFQQEDYDHFLKFVKDSLPYPVMLVEKMKPIGIMSLLINQLTSCKNTVSYEGNIMAMASKEDKEIVGLETAEIQMAALESVSTESIIEYINKLAQGESSVYAEEFENMIDAYKKQDLKKLQSLIISMNNYQMDLEKMLYERNRNWIPTMEKMMQKHSIFFAVGAGHLWGEKGIIDYLRQAGYTVTPILEKEN